MALIETLKKYIELEAKKRLRRQAQRDGLTKRYQKRFELRTGTPAKASTVGAPAHWGLDKHFDPIYCIRHSRFLAKGIVAHLKANKYVAKPALQIKLPKPGGDFRCLRIFTIPDAALSNLFAKNLISRNSRIFSASSYAYRHDKGPLDSIIQLRNYIQAEKVYVVSFDFQKYFDSIDHAYLIRKVYQKGLLLTTFRERHFIRSVLNHRYAEKPEYHKGDFEFSKVGIPQGTSISLFLANAAAHELDLELEKQNGVFCRFADDCVVITYSYEDAINVVDTFCRFSDTSGVKINRNKSDGIRLLSDRTEEIKTIDNFSFLGYRFSKSAISISEKKVQNVKKEISSIIYKHLLLYPRQLRTFNPARIGPGFFDWDLVTCLNEIRRFIYGGLQESRLEEFLNDRATIHTMKGLMAYYCLVDDHDQLHALDGWLLDALHRACRERRKLLAGLGSALAPLGKSDLISGSWFHYPAIPQETTCPSFFLAWRAARKKWERHGIRGIHIPKHFYTYAF